MSVSTTLWIEDPEMDQHGWFIVHQSQLTVLDGESADLGLIAYQTGTISGSLTCDAADTEDMSIDVSGAFWLRASRTGRDREGRVYVAEFEAIDQAGNATVVAAEVLVPHDLGR